MNKKIILPFVAILVLAVAMVGAASAADDATTVDTVEVRGEVKYAGDNEDAEIKWDARNFAAFWYDIDEDLFTENLTLEANAVSDADRTIDENNLTYTTRPVWQEYELHENEGLVVDGDDDDRLDTGYYIEGWMAEKYVAVDNNADKLVKLLVEFEDDDKKTLSTGESWDLGSGFSLTAQQIDLEGDKVWLRLEKDGKELDSEVVTTGDADRNNSVYTYTADLANEDDVPVFSCLVDAVFRGTDSNVVQVEYVFLIDNDVLEIDTSETYGAMEVMTASASRIILKNDESTLDLDDDTIEHIMGNMYFRTGDNDAGDDTLKFYPMVVYTIGEGAPGEAEDEVETPTEVNETVEANVTATAVVTPTVEPTAVAEETAAAEETTAPEETATEKKTPGFEAVFAIAGLLAVAYLVLRQRE